MAYWPKKLIANDFQEDLIRYMVPPIGISSTRGTSSTGTTTSPGILYVPEGMTNTQIIDYKGTSSP